ncbi:MAG: hypothetical protein ABJF88_09270 [Rhodothermales bacterium]
MVGSIITGVLVTLVLWLFARSAAQAPELEEGRSVIVAYPGAVGGVGIALLLIGLGLIAFLWASHGIQSPSELIALVAFVGLIALLTVPIIVEGRRRIKVGAHGLEGYLVGGSPTRISWDEVSEARFSRWSGYLTLKSKDGRKIRASAFMRGSGHLADLIQHRPGVSGVGEAVAAFSAYRRGYGM